VCESNLEVEKREALAGDRILQGLLSRGRRCVKTERESDMRAACNT
jgi:hypothetical protein